MLAAEAVREKAFQAVTKLLEAAPTDLEMRAGQIGVHVVPGRAISLGELARKVEEQPELIEREEA